MKTILKWLLYALIGGVVLVLGAILAFYLRNRAFLGSADTDTVAYLEANKAVVTDGIPPAFFDDAFYGSSVFLFGEIHGFADNQLIDRQLFELLNRRVGVRHYVAEMDSTVAGQLNAFLRGASKDTTLLKETVRAIGRIIPQQAGRQLYEKWLALYDYNLLLPDSAGIEVIGIDRHHADTTGLSREEAMLANLKDHIARHGLDSVKLYGFFGYYHILQEAPKDSEPPLGALLKADGFRVASLASFTLESLMYLPKGLGMPAPDDEQVSVVNAGGPLMLVKGINDLKAASAKDSRTLFRLDAPGSPYAADQRLVTVQSTMIGADMVPPDASTNTLDYFQYVFLLRGSPAIAPLH